MGDEPELVMCERCKEHEADVDTPDGRWVCFGCYHAIFREMAKRPAPLVWSSERPKVAGEYCVRSKADHSERYCWNVGQFEIDFPPPWYSDFEFCLIPEPLEKESGG